MEGKPDSLHLRTGEPEERILRMEGPAVALGVRGDASGSTVEITEGLVRHAALSFKVDGRLEALDTPTPRVALTVEDPDLEAARLTSLLPARTRAELQPYLEGSLALSLRLYGPLAGEGPHFTGSVELDDAGVRLQGEELARGLTGTVVIDRDSVRTQGLQGTVAGGPLDALAALERGTGRVMISVEAVPDLALLQRVGFLAGVPELSGDAAVGLTLDGSLDSLDAARIRGRIELRGVRTEPVRLAVPVYIPAAEFTVDGREISWTESEVLVGDDALISEGRLSATPSALWRGDADPEIEISIRGEHLDLSEALPSNRGPGAPTYPHIAFAHLADRTIDGRPARIVADGAGFRRPQGLPLRGNVRLDLHEVSYRELILDSLSADLVLTDSTLTVTDADFGVWGGRMAGTLRLGAGDALDEPFALTLRGDSLDAASFLITLTPVDEAIQGTLSMTLELQGATDLDLMPVPGSLRGLTHLTLTDGNVSETGLNLALADFLAAEDWQDVPFTEWDTRLRFVDGAMEVEGGRLEGPLGTVQSRGTVGMDGAVDLSLGVSIPPEGLGALSLRRTGVGSAVLRNLQDAGQPLVLGLRVAGSLDGPTMEPDALAVEEAGSGPRR